MQLRETCGTNFYQVSSKSEATSPHSFQNQNFISTKVINLMNLALHLTGQIMPITTLSMDESCEYDTTHRLHAYPHAHAFNQLHLLH